MRSPGSAWCLQQRQRQQQWQKQQQRQQWLQPPGPQQQAATSARAQSQERWAAARCGAALSLVWEASALSNLAGTDSAVPNNALRSAAPCPGSARRCARSAPAPLAARGVALQAPPAPLPAKLLGHVRGWRGARALRRGLRHGEPGRAPWFVPSRLASRHRTFSPWKEMPWKVPGGAVNGRPR